VAVTKKKTTRITVTQLEKRVIDLERFFDAIDDEWKEEKDESLEQRVKALEKWIKAIAKK
jgi:uncharacterized protein YlxW (UPF0749 family)